MTKPLLATYLFTSGPEFFDVTFFMPQMHKLVALMKECSSNNIASSLAQRAVMLLEKLMSQAEEVQPTYKQLRNPSSTAQSVEAIDVDQLKHKVCPSV